MNSLSKYMVNAMLVLCAGLFLYVGYYAFYPFETVTSTNAPWAVQEDEVRAGEEIHLDIQFCKNTMAPGESHNYFVDSIIYYLPPTPAAAFKGCYDLKAFPFKVPLNLGPGVYKLVFSTDYVIHPTLRTINSTFETEHFTVIK